MSGLAVEDNYACQTRGQRNASCLLLIVKICCCVQKSSSSDPDGIFFFFLHQDLTGFISISKCAMGGVLSLLTKTKVVLTVLTPAPPSTHFKMHGDSSASLVTTHFTPFSGM